MSFAHLHVHTMYSLLDGMCRINEVVSRAKDLGTTSLAITDHGKMYGIVHFYKECIKQGIKPIIGCEVYVNPTDRMLKNSENKHDYHLVLLAKNNEGYKNLLKIVADSELNGFYYRPRTDLSVLRQYGKGIIALSACIAGGVPNLMLDGKYNEAKELALQYADIFDEFYLEIQPNNTPEQLKVNYFMVELHEETGLPLVVTCDTHYICQKDAPIHEVLLAIQTFKQGRVIPKSELIELFGREIVERSNIPDTLESKDSNKERFRFSTHDYWLRSEEEIRNAFPEAYSSYIDEALKNTLRIADQCNVEIQFNRKLLPKFDVPQGETSDSYLRKLTMGGLFNLGNSSNIDYETYYNRLNYELNVMSDAGMSDYYLIDHDFVSEAKKMGILIGPGRGSAAGCLISYLLGITRVDPLGRGTGVPLMFERFFVPGRKEYPDIDLDIEPEGRPKIFRYLKEKYGEQHVAQIATIGTLSPRMVLKDVARVLGIDHREINEITKQIPDKLEDPETGERTVETTIKELLEEKLPDGRYTKAASLLRGLYDKYPLLFMIAERLEGLPRHSGVHAAGVVISSEPLDEIAPLMRNDGELSAIQFDMNTAAELGLLKFDLLVVATLKVIKSVLQKIKEHHGIEIDPWNLPLDDDEVYRVFQDGDTLGIFQVESYLYKELLRKILPTKFSDIVATLALGRPGPLDAGMEKVYIDNKNNLANITYPHEDIKPIFEKYKSHGIFLYQEQIIEAVKKLGGFTNEEADAVRKGMGKKNRELVSKMGEKFIKAAIERGYNKDMIEELWNQMAKFGRYGFNVAHSASYGMISYVTAWLKLHYPTLFMEAILTNENESSAGDADERLKAAVSEAKKMGIRILVPDINRSGMGFSMVDKNTILFGLRAIAGIGEKACKSIIAHRPYESLQDFLSKVDLTQCNKKVVIHLILAGAFDSLNTDRLELLQRYMQFRVESKIDKCLVIPESIRISSKLTVNVPSEYDDKARLELEKAFLGTYISGHPADAVNLPSWKHVEYGKTISAAGVVIRNKVITTKKNEEMSFMEIETPYGLIEIVVFPKVYKKLPRKVELSDIVKITGKKEPENKAIAYSIEILEG
jgi:DNA polymerase-3 subunit alpha